MPRAYHETDTDIGQYVRKAESDFNSSSTTMSKYVNTSLSEDINRIYAYLESKHISGETDSLGREKPFFNIVLAARNVWFRSTDIDRSNIKIRATKEEDDIAVFLATLYLQDWMRRENFGAFLNAWGLNSAAFNESVLKFVEQDGRLIPSVVPWSKIICDQIDFENNPKIEILELTEAQLRKRKGYDKELVDKLCEALTTRETTNKQKKDTKARYIKLYEVHGEFPKSYLTGKEEEDDEFVQQMHVLSFVAQKEKGKYDDYCLYSGREEKDPYILGSLLPEIDGSIALRGAVKMLFDAQWMENHSRKQIKDRLDLASKLVFQTSDPNFVGQNVLSAIENGDILIHKTNEPLTLLENRADIAGIQSNAEDWKRLSNEIVGISESMLGQNPPSGTAWRQTAAILQESHSLFEIMTENKGLVIERALREFIIPFIKKTLNNSNQIAATLTAHNIQEIDPRYIKNSAIQHVNNVLKEKILSDNGQEVTPELQQQMLQETQQKTQGVLSQQKNQRFFKPSDISKKTWKDVFSDIEWDVECDITNESLDKDAMDTIKTLLEIVTDPARSAALATPNGRFLFNKALQLTGAVSPVELAAMPPPSDKPQNKISESLSYKDAPEDIKRQMEQQAGMQPSNMNPPAPVQQTVGRGALPVK